MSCFQVVAVADHIWMFQEESVRCFLVVGTLRALLIDSGTMLQNIRQTIAQLTSLPVMLVNTHTDHDHISCNYQFDEVYMHPAEYSFYRQSGLPTDCLRPLWDGDVIELGGRRVEVLLIPGHTPGSIALIDRDNRILFGGDSVQDGTIYMFGPMRSLSAYIHSLERLWTLRDSFDVVYPCHARCPVSADLVPDLIRGARRVLAGEVQGEPFSPDEPGVYAYDMAVARILYQP